MILHTFPMIVGRSGMLPMVVIDPSDWDSDLDATLNCMHQKLEICTVVLRRWLDSDTHGLTLPTKASSLARFGCHVASQPVSFNIPLHRFYAFFASEILRLTSEADGDVKHRLRQRSDDWIWQLVEHPLRLQVPSPVSPWRRCGRGEPSPWRNCRPPCVARNHSRRCGLLSVRKRSAGGADAACAFESGLVIAQWSGAILAVESRDVAAQRRHTRPQRLVL